MLPAIGHRESYIFQMTRMLNVIIDTFEVLDDCSTVGGNVVLEIPSQQIAEPPTP